MRATNHRMTVLAQDGDRVRREIDGLKRQIEGTLKIFCPAYVVFIYASLNQRGLISTMRKSYISEVHYLG